VQRSVASRLVTARGARLLHQESPIPRPRALSVTAMTKIAAWLARSSSTTTRRHAASMANQVQVSERSITLSVVASSCAPYSANARSDSAAANAASSGVKPPQGNLQAGEALPHWRAVLARSDRLDWAILEGQIRSPEATSHENNRRDRRRCVWAG